MKSLIELLQGYSNASGVSAHENEIAALFKASLPHGYSWTHDGMGGVAALRGDSGPRVLVGAHMDEIGFMVQNISADGFLSFVALGGWWMHTLPSQRVQVITAAGEKITGVIGTKPPHFLSEAQRSSILPIESMFVDVGATSREDVLAMGIQLGDAICPASEFTPLANQRFMGKAFDNRVGMSVLSALGRELADTPTPNCLQLAATTQEELGLRGAKTMSNLLAPDLAIILEGPPADDTPGFNCSESQGKLGGGVQIRLFDPTAVMHKKLARFCAQLAEQHGIPYQITVRRSGGTDAGAMHLAGSGVACVVLGTPARYIHSHNAVIQYSDLQAMLDLSRVLVKALDAECWQQLRQP